MTDEGTALLLSVLIIVIIIAIGMAVTMVGHHRDQRLADKRSERMRQRLRCTESLLYDLMDPVEANTMIEADIKAQNDQDAYYAHKFE